MPRICKPGAEVVVDQLKILEPSHRFKSKRQSVHQRRHTIDAWHHLDEPLLPCRRLSSADCSSPLFQQTVIQIPHRRILVIGGAGYIGSHTCLELLNAGFDLVVMDNLINANKGKHEYLKEYQTHTVYFRSIASCGTISWKTHCIY